MENVAAQLGSIERAAAGRRRLGRRALAGYAFVAPAIILLVVFAFGPFVFTLYVSLHDWNMLTPATTMPWRGLENYRYLIFDDPLFLQTFGNSIVFAGANVIVTTILALGVALLLNTRVRLRALWRAIYFLPYITSTIAVSIVWRNLYHPSYGLFNGVLALLGLPAQRYISSPEQAMASMVAVAVWLGVGYYMILFLAGLQAIPTEVYEAATVDGADAWDRLRSITLPLLRPTLLFVVVVSTLASVQIFDLPFVLTDQGGPVNATNTVVLYMYQTAFSFTRFGRATAMAILLFLVIFVVTLVQLRLLREHE